MALTIGNPAKPTSTYHGFGGSSQVNQEAELLEMPSRGRILEVGAWIGGWSDSPRCRLCIWSSSGALLGQSAQITVANEGGAATGHVALYTELLLAPVELARGVSFYAGFVRHPDDAHQVSVGPTSSGPHYHGRSGATWPNDLGNADPITSQPRRVGSYVADYLPIPGSYVYRSGAWVEADGVQIYRSGAWADADEVQIYRSGIWTDSQ